MAVNVGTNDADDLLKYKLIYDFRHPLIEKLAAAPLGPQNLTGRKALPAINSLQTDILENTDDSRDNNVMDRSDYPKPVAS